MSLKEAGVFKDNIDYQNGVKNCDLFKFANKIVKEKQNENTFLKEKKDGNILFGYVDEKGKDKTLEIGLNSEGKQILIFQTKTVSGGVEKINQYTVFGINEDNAEECLLRAMEVNQYKNTGIDQQKIGIISTIRQDSFLTAHINYFLREIEGV